MALIYCYECGKQMSEAARACPHCGAPAKETSVAKQRRKDKNAVLIALTVIGAAAVVAALAAGSDGLLFLGGAVLLCLLVAVVYIWPIYKGHELGAKDGHPNIGALIGFLLGWIGVGGYYLYLTLIVNHQNPETIPLAPGEELSASLPPPPPPPPAKPRLAEIEASEWLGKLR